MKHDGRQVLVELEGASDSDQEELDALALELRERLLELDVDRVDLARQDTAPEGTKVGGAVTVGALVVTVGVPVLRKVFDLLKTWIEHRPVRTVNVTIGDDTLEMQAVSSANQRRLIEAFIAVHDSVPASIDASEGI
ncbi:hypothetical protein OG607_27475 [Streptomyces sp. NBC_01537]|uniref:hypothetical protein n=1 Tax=Streptomyces sp. NBC_01537 TaxID=2903896 RepID=UPI003862E5BB